MCHTYTRYTYVYFEVGVWEGKCAIDFDGCMKGEGRSVVEKSATANNECTMRTLYFTCSIVWIVVKL